MKNTMLLFMVFILTFSLAFAQKDPTTNTSNLNLSKSNINKSTDAGKRQHKPYDIRFCADGACCIVSKSKPDAPEIYYKWDVKKATYTKMASVPPLVDVKAQTKTMATDDWQQQVLSGNYTWSSKPPYMCDFIVDAANSLSYVRTCDAGGVVENKFGVNANGIPVQDDRDRMHTAVLAFACTGGPEKMGKIQKIEIR